MNTTYKLHGDVPMCTDNGPFKIYSYFLFVFNLISGRCADVEINISSLNFRTFKWYDIHSDVY